MPSLAPFGQTVSEEIFFTVANQKKELLLVAQIKPNLVGSIYVRSSIKLLLLVPFAQ
jgi:hypothetical protein